MRRLIALPAIVGTLAAAELPPELPLPAQKPPRLEANELPSAARIAQAETDDEAAPLDVDQVPRPRERPEDKPDETEAENADENDADMAEDSGDTVGDADEAEAAEPPVDPTPPPASEAELARCEAELTELGATFERIDPIDGEGVCGVSAPYNLITAARGVVVQPDTEMTCATALATARWVNNVVIPATEALGEDVTLAQVQHASTYVCRNRNSLSDTKVSEHAKANAIDVSSFDLDGHDPIPIVPRAGRGTIEEAFQIAVRKGACLYFTTVLGPGSDEYHDDHLHLDSIERDSGYRLCQ